MLPRHVLVALGGKAASIHPLTDLELLLNNAGNVLVILDNFEHVIGASPIIARMLRFSPRVRFLVTSREPLLVTWEQRLILSPLDVPNVADLSDLSALKTNPSVAHFLNRARAVNTMFTPDDRDLEAVAQICIRLAGAPLEIERTAGRSNILSPTDLLAELSESPIVLRSTSRDVSTRHRSIQNSLESTFGLLTHQDRQRN